MNKVVVKFDKEQVLGGASKKEVILREPLFKDIRMISGINDEIEQQNQLIRRLSGIDTITEDEFDAMPFQEYKKMSEVIEGFL